MQSRVEWFWSKVIMSVRSSCWVWTGAVGNGNYGYLYVYPKARGIKIKAHRYAWELAYGKIPDGKILHHKCKNTLCVNPDHLELTDRSNHSDSRPAQNKLKTHCPFGHEYTAENTYVSTRSNGVTGRSCIRCRNIRNRGGQPILSTRQG